MVFNLSIRTLNKQKLSGQDSELFVYSLERKQMGDIVPVL